MGTQMGTQAWCLAYILLRYWSYDPCCVDQSNNMRP